MEQEGRKTLLQQVATLLGRDREKTYEADDTVDDLFRSTYGEPAAKRTLIESRRRRQNRRGTRTRTPLARGRTRAGFPDERRAYRRWSGGLRHVAGADVRSSSRTRRSGKPSFTLARWLSCSKSAKSEHNTSGIATFLRPGHCARRTALHCRMYAGTNSARGEARPAVARFFPAHSDGRTERREGRAILANSRRTTLIAKPLLPRSRPSTGCTVDTPPTPRTPVDRCGSSKTSFATGAKGEPITEPEIYNGFTRETGLPPNDHRPRCSARSCGHTRLVRSARRRSTGRREPHHRPARNRRMLADSAEPPYRVAAVHRPDGRRQNGNGEGRCGVPLRLEGLPHAVRT